MYVDKVEKFEFSKKFFSRKLFRSGTIILFTVVITILCTTYPPIATAQEASGTFVLEEMRFLCETCQKVSDDNCKVPQNGQLTLMPCSKALDTMLSNLLESNYDGLNPSADQLRTQLSGKTLTPTRAKLLLMLLSQTKVGRKMIELDAASLMEKYPDVVAEVIEVSSVPPQTWLAFWSLPQGTNPRKDALVRAKIAKINPAILLEDIVADLSISNYERDIAQLEVYESELSERGWSEEFRQAIIRAQSCHDILQSNIIPPACRLQEITLLSKPVSRYLQRLQMYFVLKKIQNSSIEPSAAIELLSQTSYVDYRTPTSHMVMHSLLENIRRVPNLQTWRKVAGERIIKMMEVFSAADERIAISFARFLTAYSNLLLTRKRYLESFEYLDKSFYFSGEIIVERLALIETMKNDKAITSDDMLNPKLNEMIKKSKGTMETFFSPWNIFILCIAFFGVGLILIAIFKKDWSKVNQPGQFKNKLNDEERAELRNILADFGLPGFSSLEELSQKYRVKAKELHPDAGSTDQHEFTRVTQQYNRARELISRRAS